MAQQRSQIRMDHPVIVTFLIFAVVAFMYFAGEVLKPLALALLLGLILAPLARLFERVGLPRSPAVVLSVLLALGLLGGGGYVVVGQLKQLAEDLPQYSQRIEAKARALLRPGRGGTVEKLTKMAENVAVQIQKPPTADHSDNVVIPVQVISRPTVQERLKEAIGPVLGPIAIFALVLILTLFLLLNQEDMSARFVRIFGRGRVGLTTRSMEEAGTRISRYLAIFTAYNAGYGLIVGVGLWLIGVPYPVLWGGLAALLRFIPYVGPWTAFAMPLLFSIAYFETWHAPILVIVLFVTLEVLSNGYLEPTIYGRTASLTAVGLLVAAMFWTWLWGPIGLLLSTPLTVCLAVLGKYVPSLQVFAILLGEDVEPEVDVRFYQRLLAQDEDGADEILESARADRSQAEVFDGILVPTLTHMERDAARNEIDGEQQAFILKVIGDFLGDLETAPEPTDQAPTTATAPGKPRARVLGLAAHGAPDVLALRMLALLLTPEGATMEVDARVEESPLSRSQTILEVAPDLVFVSHLPPLGLTPTRYLVRRLHAQFKGHPILVGRWGTWGDIAAIAQKLKSVGAADVAFRLADARDLILKTTASQQPATAAVA